MSEFSASRWTPACREWEGGGTARDPVRGERGDAKIKQKRNTNGSGGKQVQGKLKFLWRKNAIETISSLPNECARASYWRIKRTIW